MHKSSLVIVVLACILSSLFVCTGCTEDKSAPEIENVTSANATAVSVVIHWTTDELATSQVQYGITDQYDYDSNLNLDLVTAHSVTLLDLDSDTTYHFRAMSKDAKGNEALSEALTFTTQDVTPPVLGSFTVSDIAGNSARISWITNEMATSQVEYGTTSSYDNITSVGDSMATSHNVTLTGLDSETTYHFCVESTDSEGNQAISEDSIFTTADVTAPQVANVEVSNVIASGAIITWTTDEPATHQVEYGLSTSYGSTIISTGILTTNHEVQLDSLTSGTVFHFRVRSEDAQANEVMSEDHTFITATRNRVAVVETTMGTVKFELYEQRTPITTANFIALAESDFYDGLIFHRVIDDFVIQGGDPTGTGVGGSDETIMLETHSELRHVDGAVSMARSSDLDSASSQFFICDGCQHFLDDSYAVFGQVIEGINVVRAVAAVPTDASDRPVQEVVITQISILPGAGEG